MGREVELMAGGGTERVVKARKVHRCDARNIWHGCTLTIKPGERYLRAVRFPGDDVHEGPGVWVMRVCAPCSLGRV